MAATDPATLDSVAARAGVSRQTVSNVLRHPTRVADATRERVLAAIRESGYRPSLPARQLATRRAHAIAVRAERQQDGISGLVLDAFYHGLAEAGQHNGLRVLLYPQPEDEAAEVATIDELVHTGAADAVVLTATSADDERPAHLRDNGTTFCAFGRPWGHDDEPHDWVDVDGAVGTSLAVRHLLDLGPPVDRLRRLARRRRSSPAPAATVDAAGSRSSTMRASARPSRRTASTTPQRPRPRWPSCSPGPTPPTRSCARATPSPSARTAPTLAAAGGGAPVTVVGFDATPVAAALGLASVAQPIDQVAHLCIDLLTGRFEQPDRPARGLLVAPVLHLPS